MSDETKPPGDADARERDLDAAYAELAKIYAGTSGPGSLDYMRAGYDAATVRAQEQIAKSEADADEQYAQSIRLGDDLRREKARAEQLERELASLRRDYQTNLALEQGLHERSLKAESELAAERAEHAKTGARLQTCAGLLQEREDDLADAQSRVGGLARKLEQAQRENATLGADNERLCKKLLESRNALAEQSLRLGKVGDERDEAIAKLLKAATLLDRAERYIGHNQNAAGEAICSGIRELREGS